MKIKKGKRKEKKGIMNLRQKNKNKKQIQLKTAKFFLLLNFPQLPFLIEPI